MAERQQDGGDWADALHNEFQYPNADDGRFRLDPLARGRYRARDAASGAVTEAVEVDPALGDARTTLDLTRHGTARGVVVGPEGFDLSTARVIVDGVEAPVADVAWRHPPGTPRGSLAVVQGGAFSLAVSLDRPVTLRAWHPVLSPAADGGTLRLEGPREDLTLRLAVGPTCEWTMPTAYKARQRVVPRVLVYHDAARTRLASEHVAELHDGRARFGGFTPGTYTLWIDVVHDFAPLILPDVVLGEGRTELDAPPFTVGSAVRVVLRPKAGASAPRISMSAFSDERGADGSALYNRQLYSRGEAEVVLAGLGAGSFQLRVGTMDIHELVPARTITLDGTRDEVIEVDL